VLSVSKRITDGAKPSKYKTYMPKPHNTEAAPEDEKSKAAGESQPADKGGKKDSDNPSNGQSIAQVAGSENGSKGGKPAEGDEKESLIVDLKKENREMKKMIRDEVIPTIRDLQQQIKKGGTTADDALDELDELAKEWELQPKFVQKLANILLTKSKKQFEDEYLSDIKDIKKKTEDQSKEISNAQITGAISKEFDRVIADNPDLAKVAKKEAVKKYIMSSEENLGRTMEDILEELYGNPERPEPGMEGYSSQGSNHQKEPDYKDPSEDDHKRIAQSREKGGQEFEKYQEGLIDRLTHRSRHRK
jgi:ribosomal protein S17E